MSRSTFTCFLFVGQVIDFNECPNSSSDDVNRSGIVVKVDVDNNCFYVKPSNPEWDTVLEFDIDGSSWDMTGEFKLEREEYFRYEDSD